jgi:hypothetical protein
VSLRGSNPVAIFAAADLICDRLGEFLVSTRFKAFFVWHRLAITSAVDFWLILPSRIRSRLFRPPSSRSLD